MRTSEPRTVCATRCAVFTFSLLFPSFSDANTFDITFKKKEMSQLSNQTDYFAQPTAAVLITNVREPPNVAQVHRESND